VALEEHMVVTDPEDLAPEEIRAWTDLEITRHHTFHLEHAPSNIFGSHRRRGILLGVCLALKLDRNRINRLAGGI
jgi:epoxyqueuosine reductase QueG